VLTLLAFMTLGAELPVPAGWVKVAAPTEIERACASDSKRNFRVSMQGEAVRIEPSDGREQDTGPSPPFPRRGKGPRHALRVRDGFFVGNDGGEWGGGLWFITPDGKKVVPLGSGNVTGLVAFEPDRVLAFKGLRHETVDEGTAHWFRKSPSGWAQESVAALDGRPGPFAVLGELVYAVTPTSLTVISDGGKPFVHHRLEKGTLFPTSIVVERSGVVWIGMRHYVLQLERNGSDYVETWLVPKGCEVTSVVDHDCVCAGARAPR
jgi:hypothetical protein